MIKIDNKVRLVIVLLLTFGVLAYLVQGDERGTTAMENRIDEALSKQYHQTEIPGPREAAAVQYEQEATDLDGDDILKEPGMKAEGGTEFFIEYRLERDRRRSQQVALLKQILDNPNTGTEGKQEAQTRLIELTQQMDLEMQLEKLIIAKGYKDAALFIHPHAVNVIIMADSFCDTDANIIGELVCRSTGRPREQISMIVKE